MDTFKHTLQARRKLFSIGRVFGKKARYQSRRRRD